MPTTRPARRAPGRACGGPADQLPALPAPCGPVRTTICTSSGLAGLRSGYRPPAERARRVVRPANPVAPFSAREAAGITQRAVHGTAVLVLLGSSSATSAGRSRYRPGASDDRWSRPAAFPPPPARCVTATSAPVRHGPGARSLQRQRPSSASRSTVPWLPVFARQFGVGATALAPRRSDGREDESSTQQARTEPSERLAAGRRRGRPPRRPAAAQAISQGGGGTGQLLGAAAAGTGLRRGGRMRGIRL